MVTCCNVPSDSVQRAFDEARFGPARTQTLRDGLPTGDDAARRAEAWLRERQVLAPNDEVLIITGRGRGSPDGVPVVREAIERLMPALRRGGVIARVQEHGPGSFIVTLASLRALVEAPRRNRGRTPAPAPRDPAVLQTLDPDTRALLRQLAQVSLAALGVRRRSPSFIGDEMVRQFTRLVRNVPEGEHREQRVRAAIEQALEEYE
jgi:hypothetical protein